MKKNKKRIFTILFGLVAITFILLLVIYIKSPTKETYAINSNSKDSFSLTLDPNNFDLKGKII